MYECTHTYLIRYVVCNYACKLGQSIISLTIWPLQYRRMIPFGTSVSLLRGNRDQVSSSHPEHTVSLRYFLL